ncbi:hypothetical protein EMIT0347P_50446 [Pseudomonas sp. IT-347P]
MRIKPEPPTTIIIDVPQPPCAPADSALSMAGTEHCLALHPNVEVEGDNLLMTLPVAPWELALGAEVTVPTPAGQINLRIPATTRNGQRLRLTGHGLRKLTGERGHLFVHLSAVMPQASGDEVKALWRALAEKAAFNPREDF